LTCTYFVAIVVACALVVLMTLVAYVVLKIRPRSLRLTVSLMRVFSFRVEMEARQVIPGTAADQMDADART
jgi:hypothetical protein